MKIGLLICGALPDPAVAAHGDYAELYAELLGGQGFGFHAWNVFEGALPESCSDMDGWLISGSKFGAYEDHAWIAPLETFIQDCVENAVPIVGICFGHQIIAQALGGKVEKSDAGWVVGRTMYDFAGLELPLMAWHQDQVTEVPEGALVLASSATCPNAAILYGDRAFTFQAHPEFDGETIEILADFRKGELSPQQYKAALCDVNESLANEIIADQISDFFRRSGQA